MAQAVVRGCPECGEPIDTAEIICPFCGHSVLVALDTSDFTVTTATKRRAVAGRLWLGVVIGNLATLAQIEFCQWLFHHAPKMGNACITANYVTAPIILGLIGSFYWRKLDPTSMALFGYAVWSSFVLTILVAVVPGLRAMPGAFLFGGPGGATVLYLSLWFLIPTWCICTLVCWIAALGGNWLFRRPS